MSHCCNILLVRSPAPTELAPGQIGTPAELTGEYSPSSFRLVETVVELLALTSELGTGGRPQFATPKPRHRWRGG